MEYSPFVKINNFLFFSGCQISVLILTSLENHLCDHFDVLFFVHQCLLVSMYCNVWQIGNITWHKVLQIRINWLSDLLLFLMNFPDLYIWRYFLHRDLIYLFSYRIDNNLLLLQILRYVSNLHLFLFFDLWHQINWFADLCNLRQLHLQLRNRAPLWILIDCNLRLGRRFHKHRCHETFRMILDRLLFHLFHEINSEMYF